MKFEDVKIGQILLDSLGNKYEVMNIKHSSKCYPVFLKCVEFREAISIDKYATVTGINQTFWIVRDRSMLLSIDSGPGKFIKENFYSSLALSNNLEYITLEVQGRCKRDYILGRGPVINKIGLTLSELEVIDDNYLSLNNTARGMKITDGAGNKYTVFDYNVEAIRLSYNFKLIGINGETRNVDAVIRVPYYNPGSIGNRCTTKDFRIIKD